MDLSDIRELWKFRSETCLKLSYKRCSFANEREELISTVRRPLVPPGKLQLISLEVIIRL